MTAPVSHRADPAIGGITPLLLYTMTSGLGDYVVMGDLIRKVERSVPGSRCLIAHRGNPHVNLWRHDDTRKRFFDIYRPLDFTRLIRTLKQSKQEGHTVFGLQMAPGSMQGFFFHSFLKKIKALDYIVDFNLVNADIITPPQGDYILDLHLNQIKNLLHADVPDGFYKLELPLDVRNDNNFNKIAPGKKRIGIHPWTRLAYKTRTWPDEEWIFLTRETLKKYGNEYSVVFFGKDKRFNAFKKKLLNAIGDAASDNLIFLPVHTVDEFIQVIKTLDIIVTVSTSTVPIGYALSKKLVILGAATLDIWIPKGENIVCLHDRTALLPASDKFEESAYMPRVANIGVDDVLEGISSYV